MNIMGNDRLYDSVVVELNNIIQTYTLTHEKQS